MIDVFVFVRFDFIKFEQETNSIFQIAIQMLKGIADMHALGLLHRDLKPENMGIYSKQQPVALLFDLGMARMYTDGEGSLRPPRSVVPFR